MYFSGIKEFTRFWALLMFGIYSCCNIIVLLNMLIAMMSNSYQIISVNNDRYIDALLNIMLCKMLLMKQSKNQNHDILIVG